MTVGRDTPNRRASSVSENSCSDVGGDHGPAGPLETDQGGGDGQAADGLDDQRGGDRLAALHSQVPAD
jgi:hypothetical protein